MNTKFFIYFIISAVFTFILTVILTRILIPKLRSYKMGQKILDIGPRWHKFKEGTPTMGGLAFIFAIIIVFIIMTTYTTIVEGLNDNSALILTIIMAFVNGIIGFLDDYVKFFKKQNEGLKASQKFLLQLIVAALYLYAMTVTGNLTTALYIPYIDITFELGFVYYIFALIFITGIINSVNLTDGIDGLASTVTAVVGGFFAVIAFKLDNLPEVLLSAMLIGACIGFLVYNFYPAKVFMGDTGSLFLGGIVVGLGFMINNPLIILLVGIIYLIESLSVIMQVTCYKLTHKRIFKMAPIHHHFEKCGWPELKIVGVFSMITVFMCVIAYFGI